LKPGEKADKVEVIVLARLCHCLVRYALDADYAAIFIGIVLLDPCQCGLEDFGPCIQIVFLH
jgi:hypothetical protein